MSASEARTVTDIMIREVRRMIARADAARQREADAREGRVSWMLEAEPSRSQLRAWMKRRRVRQWRSEGLTITATAHRVGLSIERARQMILQGDWSHPDTRFIAEPPDVRAMFGRVPGVAQRVRDSLAAWLGELPPPRYADTAPGLER